MSKMRERRPAAKAGILLLSLAGLLPAAAPAGQEVVRDGVLHVLNGDTPSGAVQSVQLEEVWRAGGEESEDIFGMISQVVVGPDGRIYLLDTRLAEVPVYSPTGERLATLSREGEGPGETRLPANLLFMPDGTLGLAQIFPGKITKITTDGTPAGVFEPGGGNATQGGFLQLFDCGVMGDNLVITAEAISQVETGQHRVNFLAAFDPEGKEVVRFWEKNNDLDFANFHFDEGNYRMDFRRFAVGRDGRLYVATSRDAYELTVYRQDGTLDRVIERSFVPRPRKAEEQARIKSGIEAQIRAPFEVKISVAETEPTIAWVSLGHDGNIWVTHSRSALDQPQGVMLTVDVFDPQGHFVKQVAARCPGDGEKDLLIWAQDGSVVQVTGYVDAVRSLQGGGGADEDPDGEAAPMEVVYLRVAGI